MSVFKTKLINKENVAEGTMAFHFEKPVGFEFKAGQYADYIQINPSETDKEGSERSFTLFSAPYENFIGFTTRMRDTAFKRVMKNMPIGSEIRFDGPEGKFILPKDTSKPVVFLTGGIGITPIRSMVAQATHDGLSQQITVFCSNRTIELAVFNDELHQLSLENNNFRYIPTLSTVADSNWAGEVGHITADMIRKYIPDLSIPIYYLCGPGKMVKAMSKLLIDNGVKRRNIRTEEFSGY